MTVTQNFLDNPATFLAGHVVLVPATLDQQVRRFGIRGFKLTPVQDKVVKLEIALLREEFFPAYYLPWEAGKAKCADLGKDADYFFTSQLTNCRFSVLDLGDAHKPKVAHVAGNDGGSAKRDKMEVDSGFIDKPSFGRARRFSVSQSMDRRGKPKLHDYAGTSVKEDIQSSAFVYGIRNDQIGWSFSAQIVKGDLSGPLNGDVTILNHAYRI